MTSPVREYRQIIDDSGAPYTNRVLIATPTTGVIRMEWSAARHGQIIPTNWSQVIMLQWMSGYYPTRYQVADAQNLIVKAAVEKEFEWLMLIEHDVLLPPDAFIRFNAYMREEQYPVVSGLYFSRSRPSEPMIYRGRGTSYYTDWRLGDRVWCDGVPTGCLLIHCGILREMWQDAEEYQVGNAFTRRVFETPRKMWPDPELQQFATMVGTSDLDWCSRVIEGDYLRRAGWGNFVDDLEDSRYPFLVDTNIFCEHINIDGRRFPTPQELDVWRADNGDHV